MSLDERIKSLARQVVAEVGAASPGAVDSSALAAVMSRLDALHEELHAVATRVAALEKQPDAPADGTVQAQTDAASRARRPRKATEE